MKTKHSKYKLLLSFFILVLLNMGLFAQKGIEQGVIRIKFNPSQGTVLKSMKVQRNQDGIVRTGITSVDKLNEQHRASNMKRVFPYAGKFESKHIKYGLNLWYEIKVDNNTDIQRATQEYSKLGEISYAEPVYEKTTDYTRDKDKDGVIQTVLPNGTNDPRFDEQWHYNNTGQTGGTVDADIDLPEAWTIETGRTEVIVSMHDGGIDINHNDLAGNLWVNTGEIPGNNIDDDNNGYVDDINGYSFVNNTGTITPDDHGTHTSGTVACETNNGVGMSGVAGGTGNGDGVRLMSCEVFASSSGGFEESYVYAADNGAVISSNSWGYTYPDVYDQVLLDAIDYFIAEAGMDENGNQVGPMAGGIVIFAAGNSGTDDLWYPGYYDHVMAVAGTDHNDNKYANSNHGTWVELAAPAVGVWSTVPNNGYDSYTGTSMACPHVAGVAALIVSHFMDEGITPQDVWDRLVNTTDPLTFSGAEDWGTGRVNAFSALVEDDGTAPLAISDLAIGDVQAVSVTLNCTAPADMPDGYPVTSYDIRYSTSSIDAGNFDLATKFEGIPPLTPGNQESIKVSGLMPGTTYYFAIKSADFFGNTSEISNVVSATTEVAPEIVISGNPGVNIDVEVNPVGMGEFNILNNGPVDLTYNIIPVYRGRISAIPNLIYPGKERPIVSTEKQEEIGIIQSASANKKTAIAEFAFETDVANMISYDNGDDEADGTIAVTAGGTPVTWSAATLFEVPDMNGELFTLTHVSSYLEASGPAGSMPTQISILKGGDTPASGELLLMQDFDNVLGSQFVTVPLEMPLLFEEADKFWVVYSFPSAPLRLGYDEVSGGNRPGAYLAYFNGQWQDLQDQSGWSEYVWVSRAIQSVINGVTIDLTNGTIAPSNNQDIQVTYDATDLSRNGKYAFDIFVLSNDPVNPVEKIESEVSVSGLPVPAIDVTPDTIISSINVVDNPVKSEILTIYNNGNGDLYFDFNNPIDEELLSIPPADLNYPKGNGAVSMERAPVINKEVTQATGTIQLAGSMAYGHEVYPNDYFVSLSTDDPTTYVNYLSVSGYTAYAGDFGKDDDKEMYIVDDDTEQLMKVNVQTGQLTSLGSTMGFTDLACDKVSGVMYGTYYSSPSSYLYKINLSSGASTLIGSMGEGLVISMACDGDGNLWGFNISDDNIYKIDSKTGAKTLVGSAGFDGNYAQSMAWDPATDVIYLSAFNYGTNSGELRVLDTETGATQSIGSFPGNAEVTAFGFPGGGSDFISVIPETGTVAASSSMNVEVELDASKLTNGEHSSTINVYSNDLDHPMLSVPVYLTVSGQVGKIHVSTDFIEFGAVFMNGSKEIPFVIVNEGIGDLTISDITSNVSMFGTDLDSSTVLTMGDSLTVMAKFSASSLGQYNGMLTLHCDDPSTSEIKITVTAFSVSPPVMALNPAGLALTLESGEKTTKSFTIHNYGMYPLQFSIPTVAANQLLADESVEKNNTSFIEGFAELSGKDQPDERTGHPVQLGAGGPDGFGYKWIDSRENGGPVYSWTDISETGTEILPGSNDGYTTIDLPFQFEFYGSRQSSVTVGANGYLTFGPNGGDYTNDQIPNVSTPNNFIAPFWDDLRPSTKSGQVFYQAYDNKFVVQYDEVGNYPSASAGLITFQVVLYQNGQIEFLYKSITLENRIGATIGIENADASSGLQVAFNTEFVVDELAVLIFPGRKPFDIGVTPVYGIIQPQQSQEIELTIDATELYEDSYVNELLITSNDPLRSAELFVTELDVTGHPEIVIDPDSLIFEPIFQGLTSVLNLKIENAGTKDLTISKIESSDTSFSIDLETPVILAPEESKLVPVIFKATIVGDIVGSLSVVSDDEFGNDAFDIYLKGTGLVPPEMIVTTVPSPMDMVMNAGDIDTVLLSIENPGGSPLEYVVVKPYYANTGNIVVTSENPKPELTSKEEPDTRVGKPVQAGNGGPDSFGYTWIDSDENSGVVYDWFDISSVGTKLDLGGDDGVFIDLPFNFPFYTNTYNRVQVASNGFLTFGEELGSIGGFSNQDIPVTANPNNLIAPFWDDVEPQDGDGVYVYATSSYIIIQYNEVAKFFGTGVATFQAILYASGDIKFQYEDVATYSGLESTTVGIENMDGTGALEVVFNNTYLKDELAVMIKGPFISGTVPVGQTANIDLVIDATTMQDGSYEAPLIISSNAPSNSFVEIPTTLTVIGKPELTLGTDTLIFSDTYFIEGESFSSTQELKLMNTGSKGLIIDTVLFNPESSVFTYESDTMIYLGPNDSTFISLTFTPDTIGEFDSEFIIITDDTLNSTHTVFVSGLALEPPVFTISPSDTVFLELKSDESVNVATTVTNAGKSLLEYATDITFLNLNDQHHEVSSIYVPVQVDREVVRSIMPPAEKTGGAIRAFDVVFQDSIIYDPEGGPDDYYGYNGSASYSAANRFIVEGQSFILTHVAVYYQNNGDSTPVVMEIYKGGSLPEAGTLVATQSFAHIEASSGANCLVELATPLEFQHSDVFYVVMHYPSGILYPAAFNDNVPNIDGVSYWYDVNTSVWLAEDSGVVYKIRAYQGVTGTEENWLSISPEMSSLEAGLSQEHDLIADANQTTGGHHFAKVVFSTNDPMNPVFELPVDLYVNKLPEISEAPGDTLYVMENEVLSTEITAYDPEGGKLMYKWVETNRFTSFSGEDTIVITHAPGFDDAGTYSLALNITDEMGESVTVSWILVVENKNRDPELITDMENCMYFPEDPVDAIDLLDYFRDPDGDVLSFSFQCSETEAFTLEVEDNMLYITPMEIGTGVVTIHAKDPSGLQAAMSFNVRVRHTENHAPELTQVIDNVILLPDSPPFNLDLNDYFTDKDWDEIVYSFNLNGTASVIVSLAGSELTLTPVQSGMAVLTIYADDNRGGVTATTLGILVVGQNNGLPFLSSLLGNRKYWPSNDMDRIDLTQFFNDPDGDKLSFIAEIESGDAVKIEVEDNVLLITPEKVGESSIVIYASDEKSGIATTRFTATVETVLDIDDMEIVRNSLSNYPNPAKFTTTFEYKITESGHVRLELMNSTGSMVDVLVDEKQTEGLYTVEYNLDGLASGIYLYRLIFDGKQAGINKLTIK